MFEKAAMLLAAIPGCFDSRITCDPHGCGLLFADASTTTMPDRPWVDCKHGSCCARVADGMTDAQREALAERLAEEVARLHRGEPSRARFVRLEETNSQPVEV